MTVVITGPGPASPLTSQSGRHEAATPPPAPPPPGHLSSSPMFWPMPRMRLLRAWPGAAAVAQPTGGAANGSKLRSAATRATAANVMAVRWPAHAPHRNPSAGHPARAAGAHPSSHAGAATSATRRRRETLRHGRQRWRRSPSRSRVASTCATYSSAAAKTAGADGAGIRHQERPGGRPAAATAARGAPAATGRRVPPS